MSANACIVYRPQAPRSVEAADFSLEELVEPRPAAGQVSLQNLYLSIDPYLYLGLRQGPAANGAVRSGAPMRGRVLARVLASAAPAWQPGDVVLTVADWAERVVARPDALTRIQVTDDVALPAWLGPAGQSGITAWAGIVDVARATRGETVVVSAAAGAVGSVAGQLARLRGCRVVGIAGGAEKVRHVTEDLQFHACVDHRSADFVEALEAALPDGADVLFENVGGTVFDNMLARLNRRARIALCGLVSQYRDPAMTLHHFHRLLGRGVRLEAFSVYDYNDRRGPIVAELVDLIRSGQLHWRHAESPGLASAPAALVAVMNGTSLGKQVVRL